MREQYEASAILVVTVIAQTYHVVAIIHAVKCIYRVPCAEQGNLAKREHLLKEALLLSSMTHYNVLSLEGVCLDIRSDMWLVTDIPALGDLKAYLRNAAKVALNEMVTPKQCVEQQLVRKLSTHCHVSQCDIPTYQHIVMSVSVMFLHTNTLSC